MNSLSNNRQQVERREDGHDEKYERRDENIAIIHAVRPDLGDINDDANGRRHNTRRNIYSSAPQQSSFRA